MAKEKKSRDTQKKIFVLDTSVIIYDHNAVKNFEEHDLAIPITVLEELDNFKKGNDIKNFEAREFTRFLDELAADSASLQDWIQLEGRDKGKLKVIMNTHGTKETDAEKIFDDRKNDHKILNAAISVQAENPDKKVILVSKDINLRLKAKSLNIPSEDYNTGKVKDIDLLYTGHTTIENVAPEKINELYEKGYCDIDAIPEQDVSKNHYYILKSVKSSALAYYNPVDKRLEHVGKTPAYGIKPRNAEQAFAIHAVLDPHIKLVSIQGVAGTGKTLIALAATLEQRKDFKQIFLARPIVPLSNKDIGYLPGDIKSKLNPYMEPLFDNLKFIQNQFNETDQDYQRITDMVNKEKLVITPLAYIRGRSLSNIVFIVDEAQNLTPHEVKTIISRAGENCKIIFTGDIFQIDTPYLDSESNGLSYLIDRLKNQDLYAHITLEKGERSELANLANELL
ncbi:PhoH family protein [Cytophaga hutchinsonii]|jgi:PhoH-like ATPase|uniref:PhoH-related protein n=1 Tax=Cytophaga hutchinsonii (strain ATCC 33406 / DSM 1761 / CIP 103989 / NBRC 15051 / NCIMB 9469 / D465) TaxID=269798 RepID=A0A6N4SSZ4_CYTH3|nr:PhoH family protein [Cytophaga hutchinsonii]ABG59540.1 phoH-related protein [Cytophaga hutchinsonii ATCC 33406]SFX95128.1 PhoH-like ATPase [Cytophaga hutchinsonii ATCC 33406]